MMAFLLVALVLQARGSELENDYVKVSRNRAPCAAAETPACAERVLVALGPIELPRAGRLERGDVRVFKKGESYVPPPSGEYVEVAWKPSHPQVESPKERIPPEKNAVRYDGEKFFIFEEKLEPGDTRARHSHSQRVVIVLNETRLQQWPEGQAELLREQTPDTVGFNPPVIHVVKNVGAKPLRNVVIELKPARQ